VSSFLPILRLGLVNPEGYLAFSLFPHLSAIPLFILFILLNPTTAFAQHWQPGYEFPQFTDAEKIILARRYVCGEPAFVENGLGTEEGAHQLSIDALTGPYGITSSDANMIMTQARTDLALKKWSMKDCTRLVKQSEHLNDKFVNLMSKRMEIPSSTQ
jgi:hypothetical protein